LLLFPPSEEFPLTLDNAHALLLKAVMVGNVVITKHFKDRQNERGFDTIDVERAIRGGNFLGSPEYCEDFTNWVFRISGKCETRNFEARVALDWQEDLELPTVIYITGICKGDAKWRRKGSRVRKSRK
jgi:hypothetical protein